MLFLVVFFKVNSIQLQLGNESDSAIVLKFYSSTKKTKSFEKEMINFRYFYFVDGLYMLCSLTTIILISLSKTFDDEFERLKQITSSTLKPRSSRLGMEIKHENPALLLEWYKVSVCLTNLEDQPVNDICLNLSLNRNNNEKVELSSECIINV